MLVDGIVLVVLLISASIAFVRGFIREVLTILGVVGGLVAAYFGGPMLQSIISGFMGVSEGAEPQRLLGIIPYTLLADAIAYGSVFIIVVVALSVLSHFLAEAAKNIGLGAVDRTLGVLFGLMRGVLLLGLLFMPVHLFVDQETRDKWMGDSQTRFYLEETAGVMLRLLPKETVDNLEEKAEEAAEKGEKARSQIDVLRAAEEGKDIKVEELKAPEKEKGSGYGDDFRQEMDSLFEQEITE